MEHNLVLGVLERTILVRRQRRLIIFLSLQPQFTWNIRFLLEEETFLRKQKAAVPRRRPAQSSKWTVAATANT
jgi:hypothetical protein